MTASILVAVGSITAALALLGMGGVGLLTYLRRETVATQAPGTALEAHIVVLEARLASVEVKVEGLPSLWEEERSRAFKARDAARKDRSAAEEIRETVAEVIESAEDVRGPDADGGEPAGMHEMFPRLGPAPGADIHERAASVAHLLR